MKIKMEDRGYQFEVEATSQLADDSRLATSGYSSKLATKGGLNCALALSRWVESEKRYRITVAYVGENGIKPDVWYELNDSGEFTEAQL